jgi:hypothetical protein
MYNIMFSVKHNKIKGSNNLLYRNHFFFNHTAANGFNKIHVLLIPYIFSLFSVSFNFVMPCKIKESFWDDTCNKQ